VRAHHHSKQKAEQHQGNSPVIHRGNISDISAPSISTNSNVADLDTYRSKYHKPSLRDHRRERYGLLQCQKRHSNIRSMSRCGTCSGNVTVEIKPDRGGAFYGGLFYCKSPSCVICSARRASAQLDVVKDCSASILDDGGSLYFATLTLKKGDLRTSRQVLTKAYAYFWRSLKQQLQRKFPSLDAGYFRSIECTFNPSAINPYHLHIHSVIALNNKWLSVEAISDMIKDYWLKALKKFGAGGSFGGQDIQEIGNAKAVAGYITNPLKVVNELSDAYKTNKGITNSLSLYTLLCKIKDEGLWQDIKVYQDYLAAVKGMRFMTCGGMFSKVKKALNDAFEEETEEVCDENDDIEEENSVNVDKISMMVMDNSQFKAISNVFPTYPLELVEDVIRKDKRWKELKQFEEVLKATSGYGREYITELENIFRDFFLSFNVCNKSNRFT